MRDRFLPVLLRQLDVSERGFGRVKRRRELQTGLELTLGGARVARLKKPPPAVKTLGRGTARQLERHRRLDEFGKLRRRDDRRRNDFRGTGCARQQAGERSSG